MVLHLGTRTALIHLDVRVVDVVTAGLVGWCVCACGGNVGRKAGVWRVGFGGMVARVERGAAAGCHNNLQRTLFLAQVLGPKNGLGSEAMSEATL